MLSLLVYNIKINRLEIQLVKLVFSTPLTFSLVHPPPPFAVGISTGVCIYTVCNGGGVGLCGEHLQEL
jgi:hypothetical protein